MSSKNANFASSKQHLNPKKYAYSYKEYYKGNQKS